MEEEVILLASGDVMPKEATWTKGAGVVVSTMYQVNHTGAYRDRLGDEKMNYYFAPTKEVKVEENGETKTVVVPMEKSTIATEVNEAGNIEATVTVSAELLAKYPNSMVEIDGQWFTLGKLDEAVVLYPGKDHRISIYWRETETSANGQLIILGEIIERFLIEWKY